MPAIITNNLRIFAAQQFMESIQENTTPWQPKKYLEGDQVRNFDNVYVCVESTTATINSDPLTVQPQLFGRDDRGPVQTSGVADDNFGNSWVFLGKNVYNNLYLGIGKPDRWGTVDGSSPGTGGGTEYFPPTPLYNAKTGYDALDNLIAAKRVKKSDVSLAIPYVEWEYGVTYAMYDDTRQFDHYDSNITNTNLYVVVNAVTEYRVFKCINNSKYDPATGSYKAQPSTVQPIDDQTEGFISLSDGYVWKFMYALDINENVTDDYIECFDVVNNPIQGTGGTISSYMKSNAVYESAFRKDYPIEWVTFDPTTSEQTQLGVTNCGRGYSNNNYTYGQLDARTVVIKKDTVTNNYIIHFDSLMTFEANGDQPIHFVGDLVRLVDANNSDFVYYVKLTQFIDKQSGTNEFRYLIEGVAGYNYSGNSITRFDIDFESIKDGKVSLKVNLIAPHIHAKGNGTGFIAYGVVAAGKVINTEIVDGGTGYSTVYSTHIDHIGKSDIIKPNVRAIASPQGAHGLSCIEELNACFCIINTEFKMEEEGYFPVSGHSSQFRQISLLTNLKDREDKYIVDFERVIGPKNPYYSDEMANLNGLNTSDTVYQDKANTLQAITGRAAKVLYVENRKVVSRSPEQIENIRIVLEF